MSKIETGRMSLAETGVGRRVGSADPVILVSHSGPRILRPGPFNPGDLFIIRRSEKRTQATQG